jgi:hypothetical protein
MSRLAERRRAGAACFHLFMQHFRLFLSTFLAGTALFAASVQDAKPALPSLPPPAPLVTITPSKLDGLDDYGCAKCHAEIVGEWAVSAHALSWVDEEYQDELKSRKKPESCHGCHIPVPMHSSDVAARPDPRKDAQHFGVSCESCHLASDGAMLGPAGAPTDAHASKRSDTLTAPGSNALCASCHKVTIGPVIGIAKDFETSGKAAKGLSCVGCHFAAVREVHDGKGGKRLVRSHALQTPRDPNFLKLAFEPKVRVEGRKTIVQIDNRAGHRVPGLIGREITFQAKLLDASGKQVGQGETTLTTSSYLPVDGNTTIEIAATGASVELVGMHVDPRAEKPMKFLEAKLTP